MSNFEYNKIGQYGNEVVDYLEKNKGVILAINKKTYTIEMGPRSFYGRKGGFKELVKAQAFEKLLVLLKDKLGKTNQFEIAKHPDDARKDDGTIKDSKYATLGWKQIQKTGVFSSKNISIDTKQQEQITLKIFKEVLSTNTPNWENFDDMFNAPGSEVRKIFPDLTKIDWYQHFYVQFEQIKQKTSLPNNRFDVFEYDGESSFMDYISNLVVKEMKLYSKKDSWNPADIWLIKKSTLNGYITEFNKVAEKLKGKDKQSSYAEQPGEPVGVQAIQELNRILKRAFNNDDIVGISLKKSDLKELHYEKFNLGINQNDKKLLPNVVYDKIQLNCSYDARTGAFPSKTSYVFVNDKNQESFKLAYKSNTGKDVGNITYEFLPTSNASAFLGKVPKDRLKAFLAENIPKLFPIGQNNQRLLNRSIMTNQYSRDKTTFDNTFKSSPGNPFVTEMTQNVILPTEWNPALTGFYNEKVKVIKEQFGPSNITGLESYVENLEKSYKKGGLSIKNSSMIQMVEFTYQMAMLKKNKKLQTFLTKCFYFAQKRGEIYNFGPFGKLS